MGLQIVILAPLDFLRYFSAVFFCILKIGEQDNMFKDSKLKLFKKTSSERSIAEFMIRTVSTVQNITNLAKNSHFAL